VIVPSPFQRPDGIAAKREEAGTLADGNLVSNSIRGCIYTRHNAALGRRHPDRIRSERASDRTFGYRDHGPDLIQLAIDPD